MFNRPPTKKLILTSLNRFLELPVSLEQMEENETIMATNVNVGLLTIKHFNNGKKPVLYDREELQLSDYSDCDYTLSFVCVPLIDSIVTEKELESVKRKILESSVLKKINTINTLEDKNKPS